MPCFHKSLYSNDLRQNHQNESALARGLLLLTYDCNMPSMCFFPPQLEEFRVMVFESRLPWMSHNLYAILCTSL